MQVTFSCCSSLGIPWSLRQGIPLPVGPELASLARLSSQGGFGILLSPPPSSGLTSVSAMSHFHYLNVGFGLQEQLTA